ncbi:MAG: ECF-type sigma factor [Acidobacteriota bacterium]
MPRSHEKPPRPPTPQTAEPAPAAAPGDVYQDLRRLAHKLLLRERSSPTLDATGLVHEAWLRLAKAPASWKSRTHVLAAGGRALRHLLIDRARRRRSVRHGADWQRVEKTDAVDRVAAEGTDAERLLSLDEALDELARADPRSARVVELRSFVGLTMAEIADELEVSKRTVELDWAHARAWLAQRMG